MKILSGKLALVTGAASGIGEATAKALAKEGARLVLCDVDEANLDRVARELGEHCVLSKRVDVASREGMKAFADEIHAKFSALDILVNNAGVGLAGGLLDTSLEDWDWVLGVNLFGTIHGCHYFVPAMVEAMRHGDTRKGRAQARQIVNVSSVLGFYGVKNVIGYVTSKFGVFGLSESLRAELAPFGIGVSTVCPAIIRTNIISKTRMRTKGDAAATQKRVASIYDRRNFPPERVANAIVSAIRNDHAVVPVAPEAWGLYALKRLVPSLLGAADARFDWLGRK